MQLAAGDYGGDPGGNRHFLTPVPGGEVSAGAVVLRAERPADAAPVGAVVSLPRPSGQLVAPQQSGRLRHRTTRHQVIKPTHDRTLGQ